MSLVPPTQPPPPGGRGAPEQAKAVLDASVIVTSHNRPDSLRRLLDGLGRQAPWSPRFEVVLTLDGADHATRARLADTRPAFPLRLLEQEQGGPAAGRNRAIDAAVGEVLVFLDDDVVPNPDLIAAHVAFHGLDSAAVVMGPMLPPTRLQRPWLAWEAATLEKQYRAMTEGRFGPTWRQFYTANASVRRQFAIAAGGFDEALWRAEDVEFAHRLSAHGLRFYFLPHAQVVHEPDRSLERWLRVAHEYGVNDVAMERDQGANTLRLAFAEWPQRHRASRLVTRLCVGHRLRSRIILGLGSRLVSLRLRGRGHRFQVALCSPLWSAFYWQGIADATGLGKAVWNGFKNPSLVSGLRSDTMRT